MTTDLPIQQPDRTTIVDVLRGFALFGVLLGNFSGMLTNNTPEAVINSISGSSDKILDTLHSIFVQNKFMTLFSILFGYGFGVIMERIQKKNMNPTSFFLRRMFWLFVIGCVHLLFWAGDILHVYAIAGLFLLLYRKQTNRSILVSSVFFLFILPSLIRFYQQFYLHYSLDYAAFVEKYYMTLKYGSLKDVALANYKSYPLQWIYNLVEFRDLSETFGRFLFGYYILRRQILTRLTNHLPLIRQTLKWSFLLMLVNIAVWFYMEKNIIQGRIWFYPFLKLGILSTALFYATGIILLFQKKKFMRLMEAFRYTGRMTLTNYLMESFVYIIIFYHAGFGLLGEWPLHIIWISSFILYFLQAIFSRWWLSKFLYGPVEWIWRQLTYQKRFTLAKNSAA